MRIKIALLAVVFGFPLYAQLPPALPSSNEPVKDKQVKVSAYGRDFEFTIYYIQSSTDTYWLLPSFYISSMTQKGYGILFDEELNISSGKIAVEYSNALADPDFGPLIRHELENGKLFAGKTEGELVSDEDGSGLAPNLSFEGRIDGKYRPIGKPVDVPAGDKLINTASYNIGYDESKALTGEKEDAIRFRAQMEVLSIVAQSDFEFFGSSNSKAIVKLSKEVKNTMNLPEGKTFILRTPGLAEEIDNQSVATVSKSSGGSIIFKHSKGETLSTTKREEIIDKYLDALFQSTEQQVKSQDDFIVVFLGKGLALSTTLGRVNDLKKEIKNMSLDELEKSLDTVAHSKKEFGGGGSIAWGLVEGDAKVTLENFDSKKEYLKDIKQRLTEELDQFSGDMPQLSGINLKQVLTAENNSLVQKSFQSSMNAEKLPVKKSYALETRNPFATDEYGPAIETAKSLIEVLFDQSIQAHTKASLASSLSEHDSLNFAAKIISQSLQPINEYKKILKSCDADVSGFEDLVLIPSDDGEPGNDIFSYHEAHRFQQTRPNSRL
jgi:hypothetical protein